MKPLLLFAALAIQAQQPELSTSGGIKIEQRATTEGISVFVTPSGCNADAIQIRLVASRPGEGFQTYEGIKRVARCDQRPVEFRFDRPGTVSFVGVDELAIVNSGRGK